MMAELAACLACVGLAQGAVAAWLVAGFPRRGVGAPVEQPAVTVLKPLHGGEPLLEQALESLCGQDYPDWQIVFGVQDAADPAAAVVARLQARFPRCDMVLVVCPDLHGVNRKVGNLINMLPSAKHDVLVIADSDVHVRPDYLGCLVAALGEPGVGLVTTLYAGLPAWRGWPAALAATQITHGFLPSAVLARRLGRQDCLGATMCLRRGDLERIGGLGSLVGHLADDNVLGQLIVRLGRRVALADTVVLTTVPETGFAAVWRHELRWARTVRALAPVGFALGILQYPLFWALLAVLTGFGAVWPVGFFMIAWVVRAVAALSVGSALARLWGDGAKAEIAFSCPVWLLPLRDVLSVAVMMASYAGRQVDWRGYTMTAEAQLLGSIKGTKLR